MISRCLVVALALAACTDPRQLTLSIRTTAGVPCDLDLVRVVATAGGATTIDQELRGERLPVELTLLDDTATGEFHVDVSGYKNGVEVMRTSGALRFASHATVVPVTLERRCRPEVPCDLADPPAADPGDPGCLADVTRYASGDALDQPDEACGLPGADRVLADGTAGPVRLTKLEDALAGARFQFYGRQVRQVWVSKDGYLSFAPDNPDPAYALAPGALDRDIRHAGAAPPPRSVMAFWDRLTLRPAGVCYAMSGETGHHVLHVSWLNACLTTPCATADDLNFTITLEEDSGRVVLSYGKMAASNDAAAKGINATVGIVDDASGCPADECALATGLCKDKQTPCGYSQVFSTQVQPGGPAKLQFLPVASPL